MGNMKTIDAELFYPICKMISILESRECETQLLLAGDCD